MYDELVLYVMAWQLSYDPFEVSCKEKMPTEVERDDSPGFSAMQGRIAIRNRHVIGVCSRGFLEMLI